MTAQRKKGAVRSFKRLVILFVALTVLVFGAIAYFAFSRTVIAVTPVLESETIDLELTVNAVANAEQTVAGTTLTGSILTKELTAEKTFTDFAAAREEPAHAGGTVTIYNNWSQTQALQAGTRLLSSGGVLFRTTERVDVPSGGSVETTVAADEVGASGEVAPGRFEIVALWPGLKEQIYAESAAAFTGGTKTVSRLTQADLNAARADVLEVFRSDATAALEAELAQSAENAGKRVVAILPNVKTENAGAAAGDEVSSFTYSLTGEAVGVAVDESALKTLIESEAATHIASDHRLERIAKEQTTIAVLRVEAATNSAVLKVSARAETVVRLSSQIFARDPILGLDRQQIQSHFSQFDEISSVDVHFSPFWVTRAPHLPDHIEIKLNDPVAKGG